MLVKHSPVTFAPSAPTKRPQQKSCVQKITMDWADQSWRDPLSGTRVLRLTPKQPAHFTLPYFRLEMFTADRRYAVFVEHANIKQGKLCGRCRLWSPNLFSGELRCYGDLPEKINTLHFATAPQSPLVHIPDHSDPRRATILQYNLDTGAACRI